MNAAAHQVGRFPGSEPARTAATATAPPAGRPLRILHLEDSASDADLAREHLEAEGIRCLVRRVDTREEFSAALDAGNVDLIIADYQLPAFDGLAAFGIARQRSPDVPFIMLTGNLGEEYAIDTLKFGVTDYILKQGLSRLAPAVHRALAEQRERARRRDAQEQLQRYSERLEELVRVRTAEIEERNGQLAIANRDLESFVASATHDLRAPLVTIGGFARRLAKNASHGLDAADQELLEGVIAATARMERLLDDLLGFFRASTAEPLRAEIDMEAAVRETFAGLPPFSGGHAARLELSPLPRAFGDPAMIRQVLANLLGNAVKFSGPRELPVVEVSGWEASQATGYCVRDNGVGFDGNGREKLFEAFQRLHDEREFPGTGLGLATVRRIVEKHGGRVWASSVPGQNATFCFTLPRSTAIQVS